MIPSTSSSYQKMMFCKKSFSLAPTCLCCYRRKLPFLYFCYIFIGSDLGPPSAATRVYFFIFLQFICVLTLMSLVLYFVFMYHFCIIDSDASLVLPAQIVFLAAKIGMRWGNNEKKFFAKITGNLFASVEKINRKMYKHFQVYHFFSVFLRLYVIKPDPNMWKQIWCHPLILGTGFLVCILLVCFSGSDIYW